MTAEHRQAQRQCVQARRLIAAIARDVASTRNYQEERRLLREASPGVPRIMCKERGERPAA